MTRLHGQSPIQLSKHILYADKRDSQQMALSSFEFICHKNAKIASFEANIKIGYVSTTRLYAEIEMTL